MLNVFTRSREMTRFFVVQHNVLFLDGICSELSLFHNSPGILGIFRGKDGKK